MNFKDLVNRAMENNTQAVKQLNADNEYLPSEKVISLLLGNLVTIVSALALCVADIADNMNDKKYKRG